MRISGINPNIYNCQNPSFGHKIIFDFGASNPKVTSKCRVTTDDGKETLYFKDGFYLNNSIKGFKDKQDFINKIGKLVENTYNETLKRSKKGEFELSDNEKKLSGVSIFIPGTTMTKGKDDVIAFMPNVKDTKGNSLVNIDFSEYENQLKNGETPIDISDDFELFVTKDLGGTGLGLAKALGAKGMLKEGEYVMGIMTGGGFGSIDIKVKNVPFEDKGEQLIVEVESSESSSYLTGDEKKGKLEKLGRQGVSVKSHLNHFCNMLNISEDSEIRKALIAAGDARIVEDNYMKISNKDEKLIDFFTNVEREDGKKLFRINKELSDENKTRFEIDDSDEEFAKELLSARISSVKDYASAISLITVNKINDCLNKLVLVGPFAHGVNRYVTENLDLFNNDPEYHALMEKNKITNEENKINKTELTKEEVTEIKGLPDIIKLEVQKKISKEGVDLPSSRWLSALYGFDVICDKEINFSDNTYAGEILLNPKLKFVGNRGSWFSFPLSLVQKDNNEEQK